MTNKQIENTETLHDNISDHFDCVIMLTWSDWKNEPRSNRYHYATRFAKHVPVFFVQPTSKNDAVWAEELADTNITLIHTPPNYDEKCCNALIHILGQYAKHKPLIWIYNPHYGKIMSKMPHKLAVYHATEDYFCDCDKVKITQGSVTDQLKRVISKVDLIIAVSDDVATSYRNNINANKKVIVLENGCDYDFWHKTGAYKYLEANENKHIAFFQGGINTRLDFVLLDHITQAMPNWEFWFCGSVDHSIKEWEKISRKKNVKYYGMLTSEGIAKLAQQASVGIIPFKQGEVILRSLPLKAYEYIACGLPVVSVPIRRLAQNPDLFYIANNIQEFIEGMNTVATTRGDAHCIQKRLEAANNQSYDLRFKELTSEIMRFCNVKKNIAPRLNILVMYDDRSTHVGTIREHLEAFHNYSHHHIFYLHATGIILDSEQNTICFDFSPFDILVIHYSIRLSIKDHLSTSAEKAIKEFFGTKILFIQDEYDTTETARGWMEQLGITTVFTNVPLDSVDKIYPSTRFKNVDFVHTLTGYVPESSDIEAFQTPIEQRDVLIGYRGRQLPHHYGKLGYEKYAIGVDVKRLCEQKNLNVDIEVDDSKRIYGSDWYRFIGSVRATLGTESGSNVFDFDGKIAQLANDNKDMPFEEFSKTYLIDCENDVRMNQISPKIFEAIRLRTALVLFEGEYSGVVKKDKHYIALKKDYSNFEDVLKKINDISYLKKITDQAYKDVIESGQYAYKNFIKSFDEYIHEKVCVKNRSIIAQTPSIFLNQRNEALDSEYLSNTSLYVSNLILGKDTITRESILDIHKHREASIEHKHREASIEMKIVTEERERAQVVSISPVEHRVSPLRKIIRPMWRIIPEKIRHSIIARILR